MSKKITLLFDIDGTLIRCGGAGLTTMQSVLKQQFSIATPPTVSVHGRTDRGIVEELLGLVGLAAEQHADSFNREYWSLLPTALNQAGGFVLPGVVELLRELNQRPEFALGILTGNALTAASIKLEHFQLDSFFHFGGYGDDHACRNEVARTARQSAQQFLGAQFDPGQVWVIGDTLHDIRCARAIQAKVIAVETGGGEVEELALAGPDAQFSDLASADFFGLFGERIV